MRSHTPSNEKMELRMETGILSKGQQPEKETEKTAEVHLLTFMPDEHNMEKIKKTFERLPEKKKSILLHISCLHNTLI